MVGLYLMTQKGYEVLALICREFPAGFVDFVVSARDRDVQKDYYEEIASLANGNGIPFYNREQENNLPAQYSVAVGWRWLINRDNLIVLHDSILPKYRGFNPLVTALINGDTKVGVTALFATGEFDTGDILYQSSIEISYPIKISKAVEDITRCYVEVVRWICMDLFNKTPLVAVAQNEDESSYSLWRDEEDYRIDWSVDATSICRFVDAVGFPYKGAYSEVNGRIVRILDAAPLPDVDIANRAPGKVLFVREGKPVVVCGKGLVIISEMAVDGGVPFTLQKFRTRFR